MVSCHFQWHIFYMRIETKLRLWNGPNCRLNNDVVTVNKCLDSKANHRNSQSNHFVNIKTSNVSRLLFC